jgi:spore maturation protein CgeB
MVTAPESMAAYDLSNYDGVLAYGKVLSDLYAQRGWAKSVWTWHEAADLRVFHPLADTPKQGDLVWIGNWGDDERSAEIREFLIEPVKKLGLKARVYGVRYPDEAKRALADAGIEYAGWLPNYEAPRVFSQYKVTVHIPRRPYVQMLPGIPTIRPFEAMACGIPLICSPWNDAENLFRRGTDYLLARNGNEMAELLGGVLKDDSKRAELATNALETIRARHTCAHRANELLGISRELRSRDGKAAGDCRSPKPHGDQDARSLSRQRVGVRQASGALMGGFQ